MRLRIVRGGFGGANGCKGRGGSLGVLNGTRCLHRGMAIAKTVEKNHAAARSEKLQ